MRYWVSIAERYLPLSLPCVLRVYADFYWYYKVPKYERRMRAHSTYIFVLVVVELEHAKFVIFLLHT